MSIHPARAVPFDDLEDALENECAAGRVYRRNEMALNLYAYTNKLAYEGGWNEWNRMARGLVLDIVDRRVVATPFCKFFNWTERHHVIPDEPFTVTEKLDGSLGICFFHAGQWRVVTRGSFTSDQGRWATEWMRGKDTALMVPGATYLFEIIYPENRIVIRYPYSGLALLSVYSEEGIEYAPNHISRAAAAIGCMSAATSYHDTLDELLAVAKRLSSQEEGFVVRFASGLRVKVKGDEYCRVHRLISNVTPLAVWEVMAAGDDLEKLRMDLPEEFRVDFDNIQKALTHAFEGMLWDVEVIHGQTKLLSDRDLGIAMASWPQEPCNRFIFPSRKRDFLNAVRLPGNRLRRAAFETFRPTGNVLAGYEPSTAINRFSEEG